MENLNHTELGRALNAAGIEFATTSTRQHAPNFEYFDDDFIGKHGDELATVDYFMTTTPMFINVRIKDYIRAVDLIIDMEEQTNEH